MYVGCRYAHNFRTTTNCIVCRVKKNILVDKLNPPETWKIHHNPCEAGWTASDMIQYWTLCNKAETCRTVGSKLKTRTNRR